MIFLLRIVGFISIVYFCPYTPSGLSGLIDSDWRFIRFSRLCIFVLDHHWDVLAFHLDNTQSGTVRKLLPSFPCVIAMLRATISLTLILQSCRLFSRTIAAFLQLSSIFSLIILYFFCLHSFFLLNFVISFLSCDQFISDVALTVPFILPWFFVLVPIHLCICAFIFLCVNLIYRHVAEQLPIFLQSGIFTNIAY